jgi:hypothetical protein
MQPREAQRSSDSYKGLGLVAARCRDGSDGSSGSQSPNTVLAGIGQIIHESWTSRRPWAFVVGAISLALNYRGCHVGGELAVPPAWRSGHARAPKSSVKFIRALLLTLSATWWPVPSFGSLSYVVP